MKELSALMIVVAVCVLSVSAKETKKSNAVIKMDDIIRRDGGIVSKPLSQRGKIAVIDMQSRVSHETLAAIVTRISEVTKYNFVYERAEKDENIARLRDQFKSNFAIVVIDDAGSPTSLVAPDDRWAVVNLAQLSAGLKTEAARKKFFEGRCLRQIMRIFALAAGGGASMYPENITCPSSIEKLDLYPAEIPTDVLVRNEKFLGTIGVTKLESATYFVACQQGWAPAPTNDVQKAIWNDIHSLPDKPMKITFDPAAQKGKVTK